MKKSKIFGKEEGMDRNEIINTLKYLGKQKEINEIILIGGAACIIRHGDYRKTSDIDNISNVNQITNNVRINSDAEAIVEMPKGFEQRLELLEIGITEYDIYLVSDIDLILLKLHRSDVKDWEDIEMILSNMDMEEKQELLLLGDVYVKNVIGMKFKENWEYFRRRCLYAS